LLRIIFCHFLAILVDDRTLMTQMTRINTDFFNYLIRENPRHPCYPCSIFGSGSARLGYLNKKN
jgi:hypothetical protein